MRLFRITFHNQGKIYEVYAKRVAPADLYGFVEVSGLLFEETSTVLVDPAVDRLKTEFKGVERTLVPIHAVVRIDEVEKEGPARIHEAAAGANIAPFPTPFAQPRIDPRP